MPVNDEQLAGLNYVPGAASLPPESQATDIGNFPFFFGSESDDSQKVMCLAEEDSWRMCGCILNLVILPVICSIGLVLNCLCLSVFLKAKIHPLVPALIVLSICDILQLFLSLLVLFVPSLHDFSNADPFGPLGQLAYISTGALAPLLLASNCASIWTICFISIQRHQAITNPIRNMVRPPRPFTPLAIITLLALFFNASKWLEVNWSWIKNPQTNNSFLMHEPSLLGLDTKYHQVFDYLLYPVCVYIIPLLVLSVLHGRIFFHISLKRLSSDHKGRLAEERRSVVLLISIVTLFFLCHTGGLIYRLVGRKSYETNEWFIAMKDFINVLFNINSMCNPMLYFFFTRQFRDLKSNFLHKQLVSQTGSMSNVRTELHEMRSCSSHKLSGFGSLRKERLLEVTLDRRRASSLS